MSPFLRESLLVLLGSAVGGLARFWLGLVMQGVKTMLAGFPIGTLLINVLGSFLITLVARCWPHHRPLEAFVLIGLMGGFTTFSAFSRETLHLLHEGRPVLAGLNIIGSVGLCLVAAWVGHRLGGVLVPAPA